MVALGHQCWPYFESGFSPSSRFILRSSGMQCQTFKVPCSQKSALVVFDVFSAQWVGQNDAIYKKCLGSFIYKLYFCKFVSLFQE